MESPRAAPAARNELWNNRGEVSSRYEFEWLCGMTGESLDSRWHSETTGVVTSTLIVYTSSSRWDFIIVPMSSTVATEGKKGLVGQKAAMGGAIKNHGLPREPLARESCGR